MAIIYILILLEDGLPGFDYYDDNIHSVDLTI